LEAEVKAAFADWAGRGVAGVRVARGRPQRDRGLDYFIATDPNAPLAASLCRVHAPDRGSPEERWRGEVMGDLWADILDQRLMRLAGEPEAHILQTRVYGDDWPDATLECAGVAPAKGHLPEALARASAELRRFEAEGPTQDELEAAVEELRAGYRGQIQDENTTASSERADGVMYAMLDGKPPVAGREALRVFNAITADVTP
jgi:hypothetical protein